jgi:hypothetical protein
MGLGLRIDFDTQTRFLASLANERQRASTSRRSFGVVAFTSIETPHPAFADGGNPLQGRLTRLDPCCNSF